MFRYYTLTELAPAHYAAVSLHPEMKFEFFEFHQMEPEEPMWRQRKRARLATERYDEFERFQSLEEQLHGIGPLEYWIHKRQSSDSRTRDLAAMATDILSIPAMSAEPERVFSR